MSDHIAVGTVIESPSRALCRCGDGTPHYHTVLKIFDGQHWHLEGTEGWETVIAKMTDGSHP